MSASLVERVVPEDLHAEREALLLRVGMTEADLLRGGYDWTLETETHWQAFSRLENIRFLLGEDD